MRTIALNLPLICWMMMTPALTQVVADAGQHRVVCAGFPAIDTIALGGSPSATGGTPPYTYAWEAAVELKIGNRTYHLAASDFLNDTTLANPRVMYAIGDSVQFKLTVTDAQNNVATHSTTVVFAYFFSHLGELHYTINPGDSVYLHGFENVFGGFPPYKYLWRPNHGLSDSTSLAFWAKPDYSIAYYMTLTDSSGCVVRGAPVYHINVLPVNTTIQQKPAVRVFPNPVKDVLNIDMGKGGEFTWRLFMGNGKPVAEKRFNSQQYRVDMGGYPAGVYLYEITDQKGFIEKGRIVVK
jgi:hypothetical protein